MITTENLIFNTIKTIKKLVEEQIPSTNSTPPQDIKVTLSNPKKETKKPSIVILMSSLKDNNNNESLHSIAPFNDFLDESQVPNVLYEYTDSKSYDLYMSLTAYTDNYITALEMSERIKILTDRIHKEDIRVRYYETINDIRQATYNQKPYISPRIWIEDKSLVSTRIDEDNKSNSFTSTTRLIITVSIATPKAVKTIERIDTDVKVVM